MHFDQSYGGNTISLVTLSRGAGPYQHGYSSAAAHILNNAKVPVCITDLVLGGSGKAAYVCKEIIMKPSICWTGLKNQDKYFAAIALWTAQELQTMILGGNKRGQPI